ncbi:MAG: hypothetical protein ABR576_13320 [Thermoanaerobaculia bacterium]
MSRRLAFFVGALALGAAAPACRRPAAVPAGTPARGGTVLTRQFSPPADGLLTDADLDLYLKVRRAAKGRPDGDAARAVGADPERFGWVQARIVEALVALDARRIEADAAETYGRTLASLRETRRGVRDAVTANALDAKIAQLERERAGLRRAETLPPPVAANARRVAQRRAQIAAASDP